MLILSDGHDDENRSPLPDSVDRVFGRHLQNAAGQAILTAADVEPLRAAVTETSDSNLDRLQAGEVDILIDGTAAVRAVLDALERRISHPIERGETLRVSHQAR
jgi:hypothetical protein